MKQITLGRTNLTISQTGFGALPIQRVPIDEAKSILRAAVDGGITFFDTARAYSDSEEKLGAALLGVRDHITLATKSMAKDASSFDAQLNQSLALLKTDHIDIYQFHNPSFIPRPGGEDGLYDAMLKAKAQGKIRFIGITQHRLELAREAIRSGLYDTLQYPFNHLASEAEVELVRECEDKNIGFIAMKALSGGLITDARVAFSYLSQFDGLTPIWGIQRMSELNEFLTLSNDPPTLDNELKARIEKDREELTGAFCRGCGYCLPCPVGIPIGMANRMTQLIQRSPSAPYFAEDWQKQMDRIDDCTRCGMCAKKCPYDLKPYETLPEHLRFYKEQVKTHLGG